MATCVSTNTVELCVLASGSGGNLSALRTPAGVMLIDAGLGPRTATGRLSDAGVQLSDIKAVCLTHLDHDHFKPAWLRHAVKLGFKIFVSHYRLRDVHRLAPDFREKTPDFAAHLHGFTDAPFEPMPGLTVRAIPLAHDDTGSHGFTIEGFNSRVVYATDLGRVPDALIDAACAGSIDALAIESNYDPHLQRTSGRPWFLQQRITGGRGHLSNEQAFSAVRQIFTRCMKAGKRSPQHVVLLHRSRDCNCPTIVRECFEADARIGPRVVLSEQHQRTDWLPLSGTAHTPLVGEQLSLAWG